MFVNWTYFIDYVIFHECVNNPITILCSGSLSENRVDMKLDPTNEICFF